MDKQQLQDRVDLKELVDLVSILSDSGDPEAVVQLFTQDAVSETYSEGKPLLILKGRKKMASAFRDFLKDFETVFHINGQQVVTINGDLATGTSYCMAKLIGTENGRKMQSTIGIKYKDDFIRDNNRWLIARRVGSFEWQEKKEIIV